MVLQSILPDVLVPKELTVNEVTTSSAHLSWTLPHEMDLTSHSFLISYSSEGKDERFISTSSCSTVITGLQPDTDYTVNVSVVCYSGIFLPASTTIHTSMSFTLFQECLKLFHFSLAKTILRLLYVTVIGVEHQSSIGTHCVSTYSYSSSSSSSSVSMHPSCQPLDPYCKTFRNLAH